MSKGLEALERMYEHGEWDFSMDMEYDVEIDRDIVEKELKEYEQYKAIEEELGIDLATLVKALTNGIWYEKEEHSLHTELCLNANKEWVIGCWLTKCECAYCSLKDYGKTWALTREELL